MPLLAVHKRHEHGSSSMPTFPHLHHHPASKSWPPFKLPLPLTRKPSKLMKIRSSERNTSAISTSATGDKTMVSGKGKSSPSIDDNPLAWFLTPPTTPSASATSDSEQDQDDGARERDEELEGEGEQFVFEGSSPAGITASEKPRPKLLSQSPRSRSLSPLRQLLIHRWLNSHPRQRQRQTPLITGASPPPTPPLTPPPSLSMASNAAQRGRDRRREREVEEAITCASQECQPRHRHSPSQRRESGRSSPPRPSSRPHSWREPSSTLWTVLEESRGGDNRSRGQQKAVTAFTEEEEEEEAQMDTDTGSDTDMDSDSFPYDTSGSEFDSADEDGDIDEEMILDEGEEDYGAYGGGKGTMPLHIAGL